MGIFGAFFLLLLIVADAIPQALVRIPIFGLYLFSNMALVVAAMFFSTFTTNLYTWPDSKPMATRMREVGPRACVRACVCA